MLPCLPLTILKGNTGSFSRIKIGKKVMDKIRDGNPLKSGGHWALWWG